MNKPIKGQLWSNVKNLDLYEITDVNDEFIFYEFTDYNTGEKRESFATHKGWMDKVISENLENQ